MLQKYRLHTRRPSPSVRNNNNQQAPQFVVVGGIWVPPPDFAAMAKATEGSTRSAPIEIYAPKAALPQLNSQNQRHKESGSNVKGSHSDQAGVHSNSPSPSSSTHTRTASTEF